MSRPVVCLVRSLSRHTKNNATKLSSSRLVETSTTQTSSRILLYRNFSLSTNMYEKRYFAESHEWVLVSDDKKEATIGISDHAQSALGDVVFVELPELHKEVLKGDECGLVESTKSVSNIYSPLSGEIVETNTELESTPAHVNKSPHDQGWICKLKTGINVEEELSSLMDESKYAEFVSATEAS